jgi:hypothetical protein
MKVGQMGSKGRDLNLFVQFPTDYEVMRIEDMYWILGHQAGFAVVDAVVDFFDLETAGGS